MKRLILIGLLLLVIASAGCVERNTRSACAKPCIEITQLPYYDEDLHQTAMSCVTEVGSWFFNPVLVEEWCYINAEGWYND